MTTTQLPGLIIYVFTPGPAARVLCDRCAINRSAQGQKLSPTAEIHYGWEVCSDCHAPETMQGYPQANRYWIPDEA